MTIGEIEQALKTVVDSQVNHESRLTRLEEAFQRVALAIEQLTELSTITDGRLDTIEELQIHTDAHLDALIDAQIRFDEGLAQTARLQVEHRKQAEERGARLDEKLAQLALAQARTDEQIRALLDKN